MKGLQREHSISIISNELEDFHFWSRWSNKNHTHTHTHTHTHPCKKQKLYKIYETIDFKTIGDQATKNRHP